MTRCLHWFACHASTRPRRFHAVVGAALAMLAAGCASGMPELSPAAKAFPVTLTAPWPSAHESAIGAYIEHVVTHDGEQAGEPSDAHPPPPSPHAGRRPDDHSDDHPDGRAQVRHGQTEGAADGAALAPDPAAQVHGVESVADSESPTDRTDLWERVRQGLNVPDLDGPLVRHWERWYADRPEYVQRMTERGARYLFHIVEEVDRRGMPMELALLPFIESAFNPRALSSARASGIWQFMPATGRDFDLKQNLFRDDRRDVQASTRAALDYLQALHGMFGDWHLALAAYNWGQGNVQRAIARNERGRQASDYESLRMPDETRNYVPKLQAIENIVRDPQRFGLRLPALENHPFFLSVPVERDIDVSLAARLAGLSLDEFHALNPQLNKPVVLAAGTPELLLPYDNALRFQAARRQHGGPLASWTAWVTPRTVRTAEAARLVGMSESQLRDINRIPAGMQIRQGSTLLVARAPHVGADVPEKVADNAIMQLAPDVPPQRKRYVKVGKQPTSLAAMARRHGVNRNQLARWNGLPAESMLQPGQRLVVIVPAAAPARQSAKAPTKPRAAAAAAKPADRRAGPASASVKAPAAAKPAAKPAAKSAAKPASKPSAKPANRAAANSTAHPAPKNSSNHGAANGAAPARHSPPTRTAQTR